MDVSKIFEGFTGKGRKTPKTSQNDIPFHLSKDHTFPMLVETFEMIGRDLQVGNGETMEWWDYYPVDPLKGDISNHTEDDQGPSESQKSQ